MNFFQDITAELSRVKLCILGPSLAIMDDHRKGFGRLRCGANKIPLYLFQDGMPHTRRDTYIEKKLFMPLYNKLKKQKRLFSSLSLSVFKFHFEFK